MSTSPHVPDGGDLLAMEIREEAGRLIAHPIEEVKRLERVAAGSRLISGSGSSAWPVPVPRARGSR